MSRSSPLSRGNANVTPTKAGEADASLLQRCVRIGGSDDAPMTVRFLDDRVQVTAGGILGSGGFGRVYEATDSAGTPYALKVSSKPLSDAAWGRLLEEVSILATFKHPNVVRLIAAGRDEDTAFVLMERCATKSLHDILGVRALSTQEVLWVGRALVDTVLHLHRAGYIHRDLKPQNLLFDANGHLKVIDFGLSSRFHGAQRRKTVAGTAIYMAPEMAREVHAYLLHASTPSESGFSYGAEVDTWGIGVVLYVLLTRQNPYIDYMTARGAEAMTKTQKQQLLFEAVANVEWKWPEGLTLDADLKHLVEAILHRQPQRRAALEWVSHHAVWRRAPLACPAALMRDLGLLTHVHDSPARVTRASYVLKSLRRVEDAETIARGDVCAAIMDRRAAWFAIGQITIEEMEQRGDVLSLWNMQRQRIVDAAHAAGVGISSYRKNASIARSGSQPLAAPQRSTPQPRVRAGSIPLVVEETSRLTGAVVDRGHLVRASPERIAVAYEGRASSTRWSLRPVVTLSEAAQETIDCVVDCLNRHRMEKITALGSGWMVTCNVCNRDVGRVSTLNAIYRCRRCDYDLCVTCAATRREGDVHFVCTTCGKRFPSQAKRDKHAMACRGPSASPSRPSPNRPSGTMDDGGGRRHGSFLDNLPPAISHARAPRGSTRSSGGGRISLGGEADDAVHVTRRSRFSLAGGTTPPSPSDDGAPPSKMRRSEGTPSRTDSAVNTDAAPPPPHSVTQVGGGSGGGMPRTGGMGGVGRVSVGVARGSPSTPRALPPPQPLPRTNQPPPTTAYLALPQAPAQRAAFVEDFLGGSWVRYFTFPRGSEVLVLYSLQPGRYGAVYPTPTGPATVVVDPHARLALVVPSMASESTARAEPHPHVQTFYDEEATVCSLGEAQRKETLRPVIDAIVAFVQESARMQAEGLPPVATHAAYLNGRDLACVPRDTKFAYLRKVFPDPSGAFTMFRLSNLRSQVVCSAAMDIRWQSDRRHNVGQKYYVYTDGRAEPFVVDQTGILAQVEMVVSSNFRRAGR